MAAARGQARETSERAAARRHIGRLPRAVQRPRRSGFGSRRGEARTCSGRARSGTSLALPSSRGRSRTDSREGETGNRARMRAPPRPPFPANAAAAGQAHHASSTQSPTLGGWEAGRGPPKASPAHPHSKPKASQARQDASLPAPGTVRDASHGTAGHACAFASLDRRHTAPIAGPTCWHSRTLAPQWRGRHPARWPASPKASGLLHRESGLVGGGARTPGRDKRRGSRTGRGPSERASRRVGKGAPRREPSGSGESDEREDCLIKRADRLGPSSSATSSRAAKASRHR
mmetsp:Transcript_5527/g.23427  ORF Transcript_5527/g.23427 Transcript_5527/m.23427 type:complete len:289 (+) Transcript_5527:601-1467(+)